MLNRLLEISVTIKLLVSTLLCIHKRNENKLQIKALLLNWVSLILLSQVIPKCLSDFGIFGLNLRTLIFFKSFCFPRQKTLNKIDLLLIDGLFNLQVYIVNTAENILHNSRYGLANSFLIISKKILEFKSSNVVEEEKLVKCFESMKLLESRINCSNNVRKTTYNERTEISQSILETQASLTSGLQVSVNDAVDSSSADCVLSDLSTCSETLFRSEEKKKRTIIKLNKKQNSILKKTGSLCYKKEEEQSFSRFSADSTEMIASNENNEQEPIKNIFLKDQNNFLKDQNIFLKDQNIYQKEDENKLCMKKRSEKSTSEDNRTPGIHIGHASSSGEY